MAPPDQRGRTTAHAIELARIVAGLTRPSLGLVALLRHPAALVAHHFAWPSVQLISLLRQRGAAPADGLSTSDGIKTTGNGGDHKATECGLDLKPNDARGHPPRLSTVRAAPRVTGQLATPPSRCRNFLDQSCRPPASLRRLTTKPSPTYIARAKPLRPLGATQVRCEPKRSMRF
jgi:hypothetical protein